MKVTKPAIRFRMLYQQGRICPLCGDTLPYVEATLDHIIPKSVGGKRRHPNSPKEPRSNLRLVHDACNKNRGNKDTDEKTQQWYLGKRLGSDAVSTLYTTGINLAYRTDVLLSSTTTYS